MRRSKVFRQVLLATISAWFGPMGFGIPFAAATLLSEDTMAASGPDPAADTAAAPNDSSLRICASAKQLPYSADDNSGFENKIAIAVAKAMGREPKFVYSDKPAIFLVRDWLDKKKCDVITGLDSDDQRVLTTKPYYRTTYVFVTRKDENVSVQSWNDPQIKSLKHIVVDFGSPSEVMLKEVDRYNDNMAYLYSLVGFRSARNEYIQISPQKMIAEVKSGGADMAAAFAPDVARYVRDDTSLKMTPVKDDAKRGTERLAQQYDQAMGVRLGDEQLLAALNGALVKAKPDIDAILNAEGIPLYPVKSSSSP